MDALALASWRMRNLGLHAPADTTPQDVVGRLGAVQSQDYGPATWSLGERITDAHEHGVHRDFGDGALLRTHALRPTWHFLTPDDIGWVLALTGPRVHQLNAYYYRQLGLDEQLRGRCDAMLVEALAGTQLTRKELTALFQAAGIGTEGFRMAYILMNAELNGLICSGAMRGKQHTYALLAERAPHARVLDPDAALAELTLRYFTSHGPATVKDFRWWSSLTQAEIRRGLDMVRSHVRSLEVDGLTYWFAGEPPPPSAPDGPVAHLLQGYDEYIVGYTESKHLLDVGGVGGGQRWDRPVYNGVLIIDSQVAGHWKRTVGRTDVAIEVLVYAPLDADRAAAVRAAADHHGRFLGLPATVTTTVL
ncbi:winged helix DNA-binding domain-containing protein [Catellatospora vulcania]|uniref:winged helix DNA-binding domain-containing protein n=1 Tax=Catellatospora vulcania TaxID=1460450 RepID=UPI0012D48371|nr:winged helix DNA-binding domain-containing protein [Catellatospora vulcania]